MYSYATGYRISGTESVGSTSVNSLLRFHSGLIVMSKRPQRATESGEVTEGHRTDRDRET